MELFTAKERATIEAAITKAEHKTSGEIVVVAATASAGYFAYAIMWAALLALLVPLAADLSHQLAGRAYLSRPARSVHHRRRAHPMGGFALRHRAQIRQARPRPSEGRGAVPGAEPPHHQGPHRRHDLCVLRRALRRGDRRRGHLPKSAADRRGTRWSMYLSLILPAARASRVSSRRSRRAARFSPNIFRRAAPTTMSCPII